MISVTYKLRASTLYSKAYVLIEGHEVDKRHNTKPSGATRKTFETFAATNNSIKRSEAEVLACEMGASIKAENTVSRIL